MNKVKYVLNGREVSARDFVFGVEEDWASPPMTANTYRDHDPLISEGIGCMRSQVGEMREVIRKHNIKGVIVRDSGQLEITSRRGRNEILKVRGLSDADAGYGDY